MRALLVLLAACGAPATWPVPAGWRAEVIPFPLDFAPSLAHRGVEVIRFAPGFFDPKSPGYWSYAFAWRIDDATLDGTTLAAELTTYFKGLVSAVDDKHRIATLDPIVVRVMADGARINRFNIEATVIDAFTTAEPVRLIGTAKRFDCGQDTLWIFAFEPLDKHPMSEAIADVASAATCDTVHR